MAPLAASLRWAFVLQGAGAQDVFLSTRKGNSLNSSAPGSPISIGSNKCLDLEGGSAFNGCAIDIWECNGMENQQWIFDSSTNAIQSAVDTGYCIDAGVLEAGHLLVVWECNGLEQQQWNSNTADGTMEVATSKICLDLPDGVMDDGTQLDIWFCDGCWNQQWSFQQLGATNTTQSHAETKPTAPPMYGDCPPAPGPGPAPSPAPSPSPSPTPAPDNVYMPDCSLAAPGWPTFDDSQALENDPVWSSYFTSIYGGIPTDGYPICVGSFLQITRGQPIQVDIQSCSDSTTSDGDLVGVLSDWCDPSSPSQQPVASFIYNSKNLMHEIPDNHWVEVQHAAFAQDKDAAWYYLAFGSAVWWNVGKTKVFHDHPAASRWIGSKCKDDAGHTGKPTECEQDFNEWYKFARNQGVDSLQFTHHYDCTCGEQGPSSVNHNRLCPTEIIDVNANPSGAGAGCASTNYKAGWAASQDCSCDDSLMYSNCRGFGLPAR